MSYRYHRYQRLSNCLFIAFRMEYLPGTPSRVIAFPTVQIGLKSLLIRSDLKLATYADLTFSPYLLTFHNR